MKRSIIALLAIVAVVGCTKQESTQYETSDNIASFVADQINTRLSSDGTMWSANESIGITMTDNSDDILTGNVEYVSTNTTEQAVVSFEVEANSSDILYPNSGNIIFYTYYPYQSGMGDTLTFTADVTDQSDSDFMIAEKIALTLTPTTIPKTAHTLTFTHKFAKVTLSLNPNENLTSLEGVSASISGVNTQGEYSVVTGELTGTLSENSAAVTFSTVENSTTSVTATVILLPETLATDATVTFEVEDANEETRQFTIKIPAGTTFTAGSNHSYSVALGNDMPEFVTTSQITEWTPDTTTDDLYSSEI